MKGTLFSLTAPLRAVKNLDRLPVNSVPLPEKLTVFLKQHAGGECKALVKAGDTVTAGQTIGHAMDFLSADVHSPADGTVADIINITDPYGGFTNAVVIEPAAEQKTAGAAEDKNFMNRRPGDLLHRIRRMGVTGIGPEPFPFLNFVNPYAFPERLMASVGYEPLPPVGTLILNAVDEEPMMAVNQYLMIKESGRVAEAMSLMKLLLGNAGKTVLVALETNKKEAERAAGDGIKVELIPDRYPDTLQEMVVLKLTGREVPAGASPRSVGVASIPLQTALAALDAVKFGKPQTRLLLSVAGDAVKPARLIDAPVGVTARQVLEYCETPEAGIKKLVFGGPVRGKSQFTMDMPLTKGVNAMFALTAKAITPIAENNCINCGACVDVCPVRLQPNLLSRHCQFMVFDETVKKHISACIECGLCGYVCPSRRPMLQYFQNAKYQLKLPRKGIML